MDKKDERGKNMKIASKAPAFTLKDKDGNAHALSKVDAAWTVIYFYPKDSTPGCTIEAKEFSKLLPEFKKAKAAVIGISGGDEKSKTKFCAKEKLSVLLLSDPDYVVATRYGSYGEKSFMGRTYMGILRNTFILDRNKRIAHIIESVKPPGHAKEVLGWIKAQGL